MINNQKYKAICKQDFQIQDFKLKKGKVYELEAEIKRNIFTRSGVYINGRFYFLEYNDLENIFHSEQQTKRILKLKNVNKL